MKWSCEINPSLHACDWLSVCAATAFALLVTAENWHHLLKSWLILIWVQLAANIRELFLSLLFNSSFSFKSFDWFNPFNSFNPDFFIFSHAKNKHLKGTALRHLCCLSDTCGLGMRLRCHQPLTFGMCIPHLADWNCLVKCFEVLRTVCCSSKCMGTPRMSKSEVEFESV